MDREILRRELMLRAQLLIYLSDGMDNLASRYTFGGTQNEKLWFNVLAMKLSSNSIHLHRENDKQAIFHPENPPKDLSKWVSK